MMRVSSLCTPRSWGVLNSLALSRRFAQRSSSLPSGSCNLSSHPATVEFDVDERIPFGNETRQRKRASVDGVWSHTEEFIRKDHDVPKVIPMLQQKESSMATNLANDDIDSSPSHITYTGGTTMPLTSHLKIITSEDDTPRGVWPVYRIMDESGKFREAFNDGYLCDTEARAIKSTSKLASQEKATESMHIKHSISDLQSSLTSCYHQHALAILESGLLKASPKAFLDTNSDNTLLRAYHQMVRLRQMDNILQNAQRQGRISFYMTCRGEEAIHIGSASALDPQDVVLAQYREAGILMWRGFTLDQFTNQCFSNDRDLGRGRQMPVHYGSKALNYHTISSPLGTQIPQAVGVAYKLKLNDAKNDISERNVAICYFGDGCASTTDFHSGLNFAATLQTPLIFFCRNNGYAISTSVEDQYVGDGIISRAPGYGMAAIRVDGNDLFAVHEAVRAARLYCLENSAPLLIEAMTYRQGHHSTSDDSTRYRSAEELNHFTEISDPLKRVEAFLENNGWLNSTEVAEICDEERMGVLRAMEAAERRSPPNLDTLFLDVYRNLPEHLQKQEKELLDHISKYPENY